MMQFEGFHKNIDKNFYCLLLVHPLFSVIPQQVHRGSIITGFFGNKVKPGNGSSSEEFRWMSMVSTNEERKIVIGGTGYVLQEPMCNNSNTCWQNDWKKLKMWRNLPLFDLQTNSKQHKYEDGMICENNVPNHSQMFLSWKKLSKKNILFSIMDNHYFSKYFPTHYFKFWIRPFTYPKKRQTYALQEEWLLIYVLNYWNVSTLL